MIRRQDAPGEWVRQERDRRIGVGEDRDHVLFASLVLGRMFDDIEFAGQKLAGQAREGGGEDDGVLHQSRSSMPR